MAGHTCKRWLMSLMNMIDSSMMVDMIYLDFSNAFDNANHCIVLHKLGHVGITGNLGLCFHQFLFDRTHFSLIAS